MLEALLFTVLHTESLPLKITLRECFLFALLFRTFLKIDQILTFQ